MVKRFSSASLKSRGLLQAPPCHTPAVQALGLFPHLQNGMLKGPTYLQNVVLRISELMLKEFYQLSQQ